MAEHFANSTRSTPYDAARKSFVLWTQGEQQPVHGGFLTAIGQQQAYDRARLGAALMPSGFLAVGRRAIAARDDTDIAVGDLVCGSTATDANTFYMYAPDEVYQVVVGGHLATLYHVLGGGATSSPSDDYVSIQLPAAPTATGTGRFDLVFLEVWRAELDESDTIYAWGSVDSGESHLTNDLVDADEALGRVNTAVQLRSRIRIETGVDYASHPHGLSDTTNVKARAAQTSDTTYTYARHPSDPGLWRTGDGSASARTALGTIDGYCLAIPIAVVHRRNQANWFFGNNPNGADALADATTTRPDNLRYDQIAPNDVDDLRLWVSPGGHENYRLMRRGQQGVMGSTLRGGLRQDDQVSNAVAWGNELLRRDQLSGNGARRRWSNAAGTQEAVGFLDNGSNDTDLSDALAYTHSTRTVTLDATDFHADATIADATPTLRWVSNGNTAAITSAGWSGLGTATATAVLNSSNSNYQSSGTFCVEFEVSMPQTTGLSRIPSALHEASLGSTDCYLADDLDDLNLTNLTATGSLGILVDRGTRGVHEVARRASLTANTSGVARAAGRVLATSSGTIAGCLVTGLSSGQAINVVATHTPAATDTLTVFYDHRPPLIPPLPATLKVDMIAMEDALWVSNLGTGGGTRGQPWRNPLLHIPETLAGVTSDRALVNMTSLDVDGFGSFNLGLIRLPYRWEVPWEPMTTLMDVGEDDEGRPYYATANQAVAAYGDPLVTAQQHRTVRFGLARVTETAGAFGLGELVLVGLTETANSRINRVGITDAASTFCAFCIPLKAL